MEKIQQDTEKNTNTKRMTNLTINVGTDTDYSFSISSAPIALLVDYNPEQKTKIMMRHTDII